MFYCVYLTGMFNPKQLPVLLLQGQNPLEQPGVKWLPQGLSHDSSWLLTCGAQTSNFTITSHAILPLHDSTVKIQVVLL